MEPVSKDPVACTENGQIVGVEDGSLVKFLGVPYGAISGRFEQAIEPKNWTEPRKCQSSYNYKQVKEDARLSMTRG